MGFSTEVSRLDHNNSEGLRYGCFYKKDMVRNKASEEGTVKIVTEGDSALHLAVQPF